MMDIITSTQDEIGQDLDFFFDAPHYYDKGKIFTPAIYEGILPIPSSMNAATLSIDGRIKSALDWDYAKQIAHECVRKNVKIFWDLDLGLFADLKNGINHESYLLSFNLSLRHFVDGLWKEFKHHTIGLNIYRGTLNFSDNFPWDEIQFRNLKKWLQERFVTLETLQEETQLPITSWEAINVKSFEQNHLGKHLLDLYCRDVTVEYIQLIQAKIPDGITCYMMIDASSVKDPFFQSNLLHEDKFDRIQLCVKGAKIPFSGLGWDCYHPNGFISTKELERGNEKIITHAISFPDHYINKLHSLNTLTSLFTKLEEQNILFSIIPEEKIMSSCEGIDYIFASNKGTSFRGKRQLLGFCAAGGTVVYIDQPLQLPNEISVEEFFSK
ncbi:hypothetical protein BN1013_01539 [Candidatus Rubidus massiliensis]|nr:hypothetical protein BN1013_01539 [Candidatus Rubidus massiliensis]